MKGGLKALGEAEAPLPGTPPRRAPSPARAFLLPVLLLWSLLPSLGPPRLGFLSLLPLLFASPSPHLPLHFLPNAGQHWRGPPERSSFAFEALDPALAPTPASAPPLLRPNPLGMVSLALRPSTLLSALRSVRLSPALSYLSYCCCFIGNSCEATTESVCV